MRKWMIAFAALALLIGVVPSYARESHAGKPGELGGSLSINSRESHAGRPSNPGVSVSGSVGSMGSGSYLGVSSSSTSGSYSTVSTSSNVVYWPVFTPVQYSFQWLFGFLFGSSSWF